MAISRSSFNSLVRRSHLALNRHFAWLAGWACLALAAVAATAAFALETETGNGVTVRWDNTVKYSTEVRLESANPALLADPNEDDGDRNFRRGIVSNRFDWLSQLDISKGSYGIDLSAAAWYDTVYHQRTGNDSPGTFNPSSVPHDEFTRAVETLHGADAEIVNAFVYGSTSVGGLPLSFRLGRHTLLWGESLFFPNNGIAGGQAPVDYIKIQAGPTSYARDVYMPVTQASASLQLPDGITLEAYFQLEWRNDREAGSGSYFNAEDFIYAGGERYILSPGRYLFNEGERYPKDYGQFGVAARWSSDDIDYGLYAVRFNSKSPMVYFRPGIDSTGAIIDPSIVDLSIGKAGTYQEVYPQGIEIYGVSASGYIGNSNIAAEISGRRNMPFVSGDLIRLPGQLADSGSHPLYPVGDSLHAQVSMISTFGRSSFWDSATLNAELAASDRLSIAKNAAALDPSADKAALLFRGTFEPTYFAVAPSLNLTPLIGLGYDIAGSPSTDPDHKQGAGDLDIGLNATYRVVWSAGIMYTHFIGGPGRQPFADRDFIRFSIQRTF